MQTPYDISAKRTQALTQQAGQPTSLVESLLIDIKELLNRLLLTNQYGKLAAPPYSITVGVTVVLLKEHIGFDDREIIIMNNDILGANILLISPESNVSVGWPITAGQQYAFRLMMTYGDKIYARAKTGSIDTRIIEFSRAI